MADGRLTAEQIAWTLFTFGPVACYTMSKKTRFTDLLGSYEKEIHRYAFRMTGNPEDAADVLQETF